MTEKTEVGETEFRRAKQIVERLLKYRSRSNREVLKKLTEKGISAFTSEKAVAYYQQIGAINDRLFTRAWIGSRLNKPLGLNRIRWELRKKGIEKNTIEQELDRALADYDEAAAIESVIQTRMRQYGKIDRIKKQRRLFAYLLRRGFAYEVIRKAINKIS